LEKIAKASWQGETELWVTQTTLKGLAELTERYDRSLKTEEIRNAIACLEALKILEDKREQISRKTRTNSDVWRFALKLPSIDTEENLKWLFEPEGSGISAVKLKNLSPDKFKSLQHQNLRALTGRKSAAPCWKSRSASRRMSCCLLMRT
jgi:hypothetical protein